MFYSCTSLTTINGISEWDTSNVTDMEAMFFNCTSLTELDLSTLDTSNVTDMHDMFNWCENLAILDLSGFDMSNVTGLTSRFNMFGRCYNLQELRLDNCSKDTINKIITSQGFPTEPITGVIHRKIYINPNEIGTLIPPRNWAFVNYKTGDIILAN